MGVILPVALWAWGIDSMISQHSYIPTSTRPIRLVEVDGFRAVLIGIGYLGIAGALFSHGYATYSERLCNYAIYGTAIGLLIACVALTWSAWIPFVSLAQ